MKPVKTPVVLMADDDEDDCMLARDAFKESGVEGDFACVENGVRLLEYLSGAASLPTLILLDLNMPQKDGRQVLTEIRQIPEFKSIPVVVFTTSCEEEDMAYTKQLGAQSFITKPVAFGEWVGIMISLAEKWLS